MKKLLSTFKMNVGNRYSTWRSQNTNWILRLSTQVVFLLFGVSIIFLLVKWGSLPSRVPLWYSKPWGEDQLAHPGWLFLFPIVSILWYIVNAALGTTVAREIHIFLQTLYLTSLLLGILSCIALIKIIALVT